MRLIQAACEGFLLFMESHHNLAVLDFDNTLPWDRSRLGLADAQPIQKPKLAIDQLRYNPLFVVDPVLGRTRTANVEDMAEFPAILRYDFHELQLGYSFHERGNLLIHFPAFLSALPRPSSLARDFSLILSVITEISDHGTRVL
ncbi:MAG: hypothetical protein QOJ64_4173 [Acidobacteriota bacterium]|nr:hypothetical protein [Acidobacteriota bacterium]